MKPFLKWAGGKRKLLPIILPLIKDNLKENSLFIEPFVGAGAVFLELKHKHIYINDLNIDLIQTYEVIKNHPSKLIKKLDEHKKNHSKEYFYDIRKLDRDIKNYELMDSIEKSARMIYLNKSCYNGLYRVNKKGEFNTPFGSYENPVVYEENNIYEISNYLKTNHVTIGNNDFAFVLDVAKKDDFIYFDPPYDYDISGFSSYQKEGFNKFDLDRLKEVSDTLILKGAKVLISNHATEKVISLFSDPKYKIIDVKYDIQKLDVLRSIGSQKSSRIKVREVLIYGTNE
jgi:DNA adenine methylase